jgi:hypothetical protein
MSAPPILETRRGIVAHLKADATITGPLTSPVPAARIFGERSEDGSWPFIRCDSFDGGPGHEIEGVIHVFSKAPFTDEAATILKRIGNSLDSAVVYLGDAPFEGPKANVALLRTRIIPDGAEQSAWHGMAFIRATVARDCAEA